jgi:sigma-B regulation protein RsbU (phosphoserine phosphatase)
MQKGPRGLVLTSSGERRQGVRHALLHTLPGRAIVLGLVARVVVYLVGVLFGSAPALLGVIDTAASVALAGGAAYFVFRLLVTAKRRLLWRVRRKLILSYIFIGFIPALLIVAFFLLSGFLLFYNFSSYIVQSRLRALADESRFLAQSTAREIQFSGGRDVAGVLARRQASVEADLPGLSIAVVPMSRACADLTAAGAPVSTAAAAGKPVVAGGWTHIDPPSRVPGWIDCPGFAGTLAYTSQGAGADGRPGRVDTHLLVRAAAFPDSPRPGYAVIVDVPVNEGIRQRLQRETGVEVNDMRPLLETNARPLPGRESAETARSTTAGPRVGVLSNLPSLFAYRDWDSGEVGTLNVGLQLSISELYDRITSQGGPKNIGPGLLLVLFIIGGLFLVIEFVALVAGLALAKSITGSVHQLFTGTERVRAGDFTHKIAVQTDDQLGELSVSFNSMTASIEDLLQQAAEKKRLEEELRIAREIQMSLLPQGPLEMPGLSVTALCVPAREVGGDYYDFFRLGERQLGILIADVSGKGTSAALYMAELKGLMLSLSQIHRSPRDLMLAANHIIAANLDARSFITMTYAVIDLDLATMTYARAGHTPLMYVPGPGCDQDRHVQVLAPDGLVLGLNIDKGEMFARLLVERTIKLHAGDLALFFTDGISEAMNDVDDFFGEARLALLIEEHAHLSSDELRERVLREVQAFVGSAPQHDDMTMVFLKIDAVGVLAALEAETVELAKY